MEQIYHIFNRSIADYNIFNNKSEFERILQLIQYYQIDNTIRFSDFVALEIVQKCGFNNFLRTISTDKVKSVQIIAYCLMPTHFHLILKQLVENGISNYMRKVLDGYTRYFNNIHKRRGPLWESKFKNVLVEGDEQLNHLVRYIHLNPTTANLVNSPEDWLYSSYREYLGRMADSQKMCQFDDILEIKPSSYRKFVNDQISYQRELAKIKKLILD